MTKNIDSYFCVTTTALRRPEIFEQTLYSFKENIYEDISCLKLYLNVDPLPKDESINAKMIEVAKKFFHTVKCNFSQESNLTKALDWCWSTADSNYILHLEDDWILKHPISLMSIKEMFENNENVYQVILRAYGYIYDKSPTSPSVIKKKFYKAFSGKFDYRYNAEIQLRNPSILEIGEENIITIGEKPIVFDIGSPWREKHGYVRNPNKKFMIGY